MSLTDLITAHQRSMAVERASGPVPSSSSAAIEVVPRPTVYVHAGQVFASPVGTDVTTILGSCVAICLWDTKSGIGGINHYMLSLDRAAASNSLRHAGFATEELLLALSRFGVVRSRLQAKVFGGACILQSFRQGGSDLGQKNVEMARSLLQTEHIPVVGEDVGGPRGRKLIFSTDSGEALVKRL
ncbi:MAG TPA: chemotaxis protein CheD [Thermoanaerobaculia bacterium]|nr:chemotaxis protein CheD [Thermoanaerobaculia bacterium]